MDKVETIAAAVRSKASGDTVVVPMEPLVCDTCGCVFSVPEIFFSVRERDNKPICCPNGHRRHYWQRPAARSDIRRIHEDEQREAREADGRKGAA